MSLPEFCHCDRTPAAVVLSVMAVIPLLMCRGVMVRVRHYSALTDLFLSSFTAHAS
jgi:nitrate reductase gamma subunit